MRSNVKLRQTIICALLLAIGHVLHLLVTPFLGGMKFDLLLSMLFVALLVMDNPRVNIATGLLAGLLTAATTTFPGGQIPNMIDKIIVTLVLVSMLQVFRHRLSLPVLAGLMGVFGTLLSGTIFLTSALFIVGLPAPFATLFLGVVVPATVANGFITVVVALAVKPALAALRVAL